MKRKVQTFCAYAETQFGKHVKTVRSDNGMEFMCMSSFFNEKGIVHQTSWVGTPQQNGRVERKHRHLLNVARSLMFQAAMPIKFWGEAVLATAHLINLTPTRVLRGKSPHELLYGIPPSYSELRVFGSLCYAHKQLRDKNKFASRSRRSVFVGYPFGKKGWILYDLEKKFFVSRDVVFKEDKFPFSVPVAESVPRVIRSEVFDEDHVLNEVGVVESRGSSDKVVDNIAEPVDSLTDLDPAIVEVGPQIPAETGVSATEDVTDEESAPPIEVEAEVLGRGQRVKVPSVKLNDYVTYTTVSKNSIPHVPASDHSDRSYSVYFDPVSGKTLYPLTEYITDENFSSGHKAFLAAVCAVTEPKSFKEAMKDKRWTRAVYKEVDALEEADTWDVVDLPPGRVALSTMWVFKIKYNAYGTVERYEVRLVVLGNRQKEGCDKARSFRDKPYRYLTRCI